MGRSLKIPAPLGVLASIALIAVPLFLLWQTAVQMVERNGHGLAQKEQQLKPRPPVQAPTPAQHPAAPSDAEIQRHREIAEAYRAAELRKQEAWERFYQPPRACLHPESVQRAEVCRANEQKQRKEFESAWAEQLLRERQAQQ